MNYYIHPLNYKNESIHEGIRTENKNRNDKCENSDFYLLEFVRANIKSQKFNFHLSTRAFERNIYENENILEV